VQHPPAYVAQIDAATLARDPVVRLANDIEELYRQSGCATEADLRRRGWTPANLARYGDDARARVRARIDAEATRAERDTRRPRRPRTTPPPALGQGRRSRAAR
jgi:hypothetical protein